MVSIEMGDCSPETSGTIYYYYYYYYYYYCFIAPWTLSGTTLMSQFQKGKITKVKLNWIYWSKK